ncbi:MAG TPA: DUF6666 family protein [Planctomycetaceae bacterium]|nr:DUF6666 family protein [Planctomycetaceae bacterium]
MPHWPRTLALSVLIGGLLASPGFGQDDSLEAAADAAFYDPDLALVSNSYDAARCETDACCQRSWLDGLELFIGLEGSKQPQDFGVNAQFGGRAHANYGGVLWEDRGLGWQLGTGLNQTDHAVAVTSAIEGSSSRTQSFTTLGVFQRTDNGWIWAVAYDYLYQEDYDAVTLSQWRGRVGRLVNDCNEVGVFGMLPDQEADAVWAGTPVHLEPLAQASAYWRHTWQAGGETTFWLGVAESHGQANAALGDRPDTGGVIVFGSDLHVPLNDRWALFGEANFVTPADTGTVDAYLGFAYYPGGGAFGWRKQQFSPALPVANNTSFVTNLTR